MQSAKDSFSTALRERLTALNPARTVKLNGTQRPAVVVVENELPTAAERLYECFYLEFGTIEPVEGTFGERPICAIDCNISYCTRGTVVSGVDRGPVLGEMDRELLMICQPRRTGKRDFSQSPNVDLGTSIFWTLPSFQVEAKTALAGMPQDGAVASHQAQVRVFFSAEVDSL